MSCNHPPSATFHSIGRHMLLLPPAMPPPAQWRTIKFPLETVRPFVFESVALAEVKPALDPEKPEVGRAPCPAS